jgi:putative ABC transport system permease protein
MNSFWQDVRYGARQLARSPGFSAVAVLTLALGIGATTAIFSVIHAVLLRPLPFPDPQSLVVVWETDQKGGSRTYPVSSPNFKDWRAQSKALESLVVFRDLGLTLTGVGDPERLPAARVSADFFRLLNIEPALGRAFRSEEDEPGAENVVILSHGLWQQRFGADPSLVGRNLTLSGESYRVVGVLPADLEFPFQLREAQAWTPMGEEAWSFTERGSHFLGCLARLRPGVSLAQAQAEMDAIAAQLAQQYPDENSGHGINLVPLHAQVVGEVRLTLLVLLSAVGFVLLIACANLASLLLVRGTARAKEFAIRAALGAPQSRLLRQLLTESLLLSLVGGGTGLLLSLWGLEGIKLLLPADFPRLAHLRVDITVMGFALLVSLGTGFLFGLAPALRASQVSLQTALKEGGPLSRRLGRDHLRQAFVVAEYSLALVLLVGTGLLLQSLWQLLRVDTGFSSDRVLTFSVSLPAAKYPQPAQRTAYFQAVQERLRALPGVESVSANTTLPFSQVTLTTGFSVEGRPELPPAEQPNAVYNSVLPDYFKTLGIPLLRGRTFSAHDTRQPLGALIINNTMARLHWPNEDPLGQRLRIGMGVDDTDPPSYEIVGVVGDVRQQNLESEPHPTFYVPYTQQSWSFLTFVVRATGDPLALAAAIRDQVRAVDPDQPVTRLALLNNLIERTLAPRRVTLFLLLLFAGAALALGAMGIYGVASFMVTQRVQEIGVRMALGAEPRQILLLFVQQGMLIAAGGLVVGLAGALVLTRFLRTLLFGVTPADPLTLAGTSLLLLVVAGLACYLPARRATRVDPMTALRYE